MGISDFFGLILSEITSIWFHGYAVVRLNGKVERSHRSDQEDFYQLLKYKNDVDLEKRLYEWEQFYNFARPHGAHKGKPLMNLLEIS